MRERRVTPDLRRQVAERARGCCEYWQSQARYATQAFSVEHIVAQARGGQTELANLALACQGCNNYKYDKSPAHDPMSGQQVPLYHPRRDLWDEHLHDLLGRRILCGRMGVRRLADT